MNTRFMTRTALLLALAIAVQQLKIQWLTGPAINALLILAVGYAGLYSGMLLGVMTPILAFMQGFMPIVIVLPFIMLGNVLYCVGYNFFKDKNGIVGIVLASIMKFLFFALAINLVIELPAKVSQMLGIPQLITALVGGFIALAILKYLPLDLEENKAK